MPYVPLAAAIAAAVHDATGVWFGEFPLTPERRLAGIRAAAVGRGTGGTRRNRAVRDGGCAADRRRPASETTFRRNSMHAGDPEQPQSGRRRRDWRRAAGLRAAIEVAEQGGDVLLVTKGQAARSGAQRRWPRLPTRRHLPSRTSATASKPPSRTPASRGATWGTKKPDLGIDQRGDRARHGAPPLGAEVPDQAERQVPSGGPSRAQLRAQSGDRRRRLRHGGAGLLAKVRTYPNVRVAEDLVVTKILTRSGQVVGVMVGLDMRTGARTLIETGALIVATGGYQELWRWTDTEPGLSGEGVYQCYEAGAELVRSRDDALLPDRVSLASRGRRDPRPVRGLLTAKYCQAPMLNGKGERSSRPRIGCRFGT